MIIDKANKGFQTRSDIQNENWTNDDVFIVDDSSELALKVTQYYPYYDFILGVDGDLIDITPTERPIEQPKQPTETELLNQKITMLQKQLDSAKEAIDFLLMGGM